jgi:hypothetical protein
MEEIEKKICQTIQECRLKKRCFRIVKRKKNRKNQITTTQSDGHSASVIPSQAAVL